MASCHRNASTDLRSEEVADLHSLAVLAGISLPPHALSILIEMLRSGTPPAALYSLLRHIAKQSVSNKSASRGSADRSEHVPSSSKRTH